MQPHLARGVFWGLPEQPCRPLLATCGRSWWCCVTRQSSPLVSMWICQIHGLVLSTTSLSDEVKACIQEFYLHRDMSWMAPWPQGYSGPWQHQGARAVPVPDDDSCSAPDGVPKRHCGSDQVHLLVTWRGPLQGQDAPQCVYAPAPWQRRPPAARSEAWA